MIFWTLQFLLLHFYHFKFICHSLYLQLFPNLHIMRVMLSYSSTEGLSRQNAEILLFRILPFVPNIKSLKLYTKSDNLPNSIFSKFFYRKYPHLVEFTLKVFSDRSKCSHTNLAESFPALRALMSMFLLCFCFLILQFKTVWYHI